MTGQMFLRTAQTEDRISELEKQMARVLEHLNLDEPPKPKPQPDPEPEPEPEPEPPQAKQLVNKRRRA
jgi:hypothetical protein